MPANDFGMNDDTFGLQSPDALLQTQADAYDKAQQNSNATVRNVSSGLYGITNAFGGGPAVTQARRTQAAMQDIMSQVNANSDPNEDPLTKQLRQAQAISQGMIGVDPNVALRAQDQAVRLSQAAKQQQLLSLQTDVERQTLSNEQYKSQVDRNTPKILYTAVDQGKDENNMPLGYKPVKAYDLTDPNTAAQLRADMQAAQDSGSPLQVMTPDQMAQTKLQSAQAAGQARIQASIVAAQQREQSTLDKINNPNAAGGRGSAMQQMYNQRMLSAADGASGALETIAAMPFGSNTGYFAQLTGTVSVGKSLFDVAGGVLRQALTTDDQKLYNSYTAGLGMNIAMLEKQGGLAGGTAFMNQIQAKLAILPTDSPLVIMGKLAEARASIDRNIEITMAAKTTDPDIKALMEQRLEQMHKAIPFTRADVNAFDAASKADPGLTYTQWAQKNNVVNADSRNGGPVNYPTPQMGTDANGKPGRAVFGGGRQLNGDTGQPMPQLTTPNPGDSGPAVSGSILRGNAASRGYGDPLGNQIYGNQ